ncbi:hypothetical protein GUITHDRAFT_135154 [Guillardia theta CCMP2712]|uniref:Glycosyl transferase family 1 domain-containing protein n=1 Tax=Guillardia theta (strain CCMP2712) TaxID=905079 RepID=L1JQX3_GUITC|nr:hypothetical protein GUITHDRAFT_135154 [Guillardia theta CCMP2712]EKX50488.1 hypothetical protein GUITHDRAFT_135154 [Guillardia theta CCMP2712]|eukprot:XP_005837468.1 hypothetical protein GUITHDRAFT_135154 [Guillardia theta CCMP2712]
MELHKHANLAVVQHGDSVNPRFVEGLPAAVKETLQKAMYTRFPPRSTIDICHSEPGAWSVPTPMYPTSTCPSEDRLYAVGRTMFETDRLPDGWLRRLKAMDEIWVPSKFHEKIFEDAGLARESIHVIPEAVDTELFDPTKSSPHKLLSADKRFKFLSVFKLTSPEKWEARKGWDILLEAFLSQFPAKENRDISNIIVLDEDIPLKQMTQLYAVGEAAHRGHGHVVATNWSGNTEFMKDYNSFLIPIEGLEPVREGAFTGHLWARPSVKGLMDILKKIFENPNEAKRIAKVGMEEVRKFYNPDAVANVVMHRLRAIEQILAQRSVRGEL